MPLKKPSEFYDKNPNSSLDEIRENVTPQKVEKISEAFDSFKSNFDHIQTLTEFTNTFDTFKNNIEKVDSLTESVSDINDSIQDLIKKEDLDDAMTAQLLFVEESIRSVQDKVKTLNSKSVFAIKEEFSSLSETVYNFIDEEVPSYHKLIVDSETRVDSRFLNFKYDITSKVEYVNKEINSIQDLKGLKMRIPGFGGKVLSKVGGSAVTVAGGEIYTNLERGVIDATEWIGPYHDYLMGFYQVAKYYYYPGWHEPGGVLEMIVNKKKFYNLPSDLQEIIIHGICLLYTSPSPRDS